MKRIIHLSDLHFGTEKPDLLFALIKDCEKLNPDIITVSGDLTQRAKSFQYRLAKQFLENFKSTPIVCVPGNHDISLYNLFERFFYPFSKYQKWINQELCTHYSDETVSILGINSVTPYKPMGGYVTDEQLSMAKNYFENEPANTVRIIVMHHNLIRSERHHIINDADKILQLFANAKVNLVLSGHIHFPYIEKITHLEEHPLYVITAGTPISNRTSEPNSYNVIEVVDKEFKMLVRTAREGNFVTTSEMTYPL